MVQDTCSQQRAGETCGLGPDSALRIAVSMYAFGLMSPTDLISFSAQLFVLCRLPLAGTSTGTRRRLLPVRHDVKRILSEMSLIERWGCTLALVAAPPRCMKACKLVALGGELPGKGGAFSIQRERRVSCALGTPSAVWLSARQREFQGLPTKQSPDPSVCRRGRRPLTPRGNLCKAPWPLLRGILGATARATFRRQD